MEEREDLRGREREREREKGDKSAHRKLAAEACGQVKHSILLWKQRLRSNVCRLLYIDLCRLLDGIE